MAGGRRGAPCQRHVNTSESGGKYCYAEHHFPPTNYKYHQYAPARRESQRESVRAVTDGGLYDVTDMREWREGAAGILIKPIPDLANGSEQRGFVGTARHFIDCVQNRTVPGSGGEQAILAQRVVEALWQGAISGHNPL